MSKQTKTNKQYEAMFDELRKIREDWAGLAMNDYKALHSFLLWCSEHMEEEEDVCV